jgi:ribosomal protein S18 acetylase RimI-like enzyme
VLEAGISLTRGARGRGLGRAVMVAVLQQAVALEAAEVRAQTTPGNTAALSVLRSWASPSTLPLAGGRSTH